MFRVQVFVAMLTLSAASVGQIGPPHVVNCSRGGKLQEAINEAAPNAVIKVAGTCTGPFIVAKDSLTIDGLGSAILTAPGANVLTVNGGQRLQLTRITVSGGNNGIVAENNGELSLNNTTISGNALTGLQVIGSSTATLVGDNIANNGLFGVDVEASSSLIVTATGSIQGNGVFGIQVNNGSSLTLTAATLHVNGNTLGIQLGTNAAGFLDGTSSLDTSGNFADGFTIVSGSHVVNFGGIITSSGNGIHGISLNSKAGLDMDAGSQVTVQNNGADGVHLERESSMTIFNNPNFSGNPGTTTLTASGNQANGINVQTNSGLLVSNYAAIQNTGNAQAGLALDDGSSLSFTQTIPVNGVQTSITANHPDLLLTFGSRLSLLSNDQYGTAACDATVLTRGPNAPLCPMAKKQ